jgi:ArsR family transcriptional regulator, arsenate/arsenite/antimonite-responsive transcriptional repressor
MDRARLERIGKALADRTRLRILEQISARAEMTCGDIVSLRGVRPATVSHHLKILQDAGLIESRKEGQFVYSRAVPGTIEKYGEALAKLTRRKRRRHRQ